MRITIPNSALIIAVISVSMGTYSAPAVDLDDIRSHFSQSRASMMDLEALKDDIRAASFDEMMWTLNVAVDHGEDLRDISSLGAIKRPDGSVSLDVKANPGWLKASDHLVTFSNLDAISVVKGELIERGFTHEDFEVLRSYVEQNPLDQAKLAGKVLGLAKSTEAKIRANARSGKDSTATLEKFSKRTYLLNKEFQRQWSIKLLTQLRPHARRIINAWVTDSLESVTLFPTNRTEALRNLEQQFLDGTYVDQLSQLAGEEQ